MQKRLFILGAKADGHATRTRTRGSPDAMNVRLRFVRDVIIDDVRHVVHVNSSTCDIGCDEQRGLSRLELLHRTFTGVLTLVAVNRLRRDAHAMKLPDDSVCTVLRSREDDSARDGHLLVEISQKLDLVGLIDVVKKLFDIVGGLTHASDLDDLWIMKELPDQFADFARHRRAEHHRLPLGGQMSRNPLDVVDESHVEHAIGFVKDKHLNLIEANELLTDQIQQATGRGDHDIDAAAQCVGLPVLTHPAEDGRDPDVDVASVCIKTLGDLQREFARRREHKRTRCGRFGLCTAAQSVEHWQCERSGLARSGLRDAQHVMTLKQMRNRLCLNRRGREILLLLEGAQDRLGQPKIRKLHDNLSKPSYGLAADFLEHRNDFVFGQSIKVRLDRRHNDTSKIDRTRAQQTSGFAF